MSRHILVPRDRKHLKEMVRFEMNAHGNACDLNHIDVSAITDFSMVFASSMFVGNVSRWNVEQGANFSGMFENSNFNGDISRWDVGQVRCMEFMFENSAFNQDLSSWNVEQVITTRCMFKDSPFDQDISRWQLRAVLDMGRMFQGSAFNQPIATWNFSNMSKWRQAKAWREESYEADASKREQVQNDAGLLTLMANVDDEPGHERAPYSCLAMFKDSAFSHDISMCNMPFDAGMQDLFSGNEKGLAMQGISPWILRLHLEQGSSPTDPEWKGKVDALRSKHPDLKTFAGVCALSMWHDAQGTPIPARQAEQPKTLWELSNLVNKEMLEQGPSADLNHIDVSGMVSLCGLFKDKNFTGNISTWDVSGVYDMRSLFENCPFDGDISNWDVANVGQMDNMFKGDIGGWTFKRLLGCARMFANSAFDRDIAQWKFSENFGKPACMAHYDARMCGVTTNAQASLLWNSAEGKKIWRDRQYWIQDNEAQFNANEMFAGSAFKHDISSWKLLATPNAGMFKDNDAGLAAQKLSPWLLRYLLDEKKPLSDPKLEKMWEPARAIVSVLFPSTQEQAQEAWTMLQHELTQSTAGAALEINDFEGFLAP